MTFKQTKLVLGIATLAMGAALVSPQAMAHKSSKKHHHASQPSYSKVDLLESQVRAMQDEIASLRSAQASAAPAVDPDTAKVEELDQWMASVKAAPVIEKTKDNMMFFRGGYGHANGTRGGTLDPT
ncbi:MAG: porin family protein, partial [Methylococcales bacterium]